MGSKQRASEYVDGSGGERGFGDWDFHRWELLHFSERRSSEPDCDYIFAQLVVSDSHGNDDGEWSA
jgi:hypothetical protein